MKKTAATLLMVSAVLAVAVTGCRSSSAPTIGYAYVMNEQGISDRNQAEIWTGIQSYADTMGASAGRFISESADADGYAKVMNEAADAGAKTIVCDGADMETAVYAAQKAHAKTNFILIGGEPREKMESEADIGDRTLCITYAIEQAGFLAGYGCVQEGWHSLGYMAGVKTDEAVKYEGGFVSGAEAAAADLGLGADSVSVKVNYAGSDELTPLRMNTALTMYDSGCAVIMTCGDNIRTAAVKAAKLRGKYVISAGTDARTESDRIIMGTMLDSKSTVNAALQACDQKDFKGGTMAYGIREGSVGLAADFTFFKTFTEDAYKKEAAKLAAGTVNVSAEEQTGGSAEVKVTVS